MSELVISNVDLKDLDLQRQTLATIDRSKLSSKQQVDALSSIQNMLDDWSDSLYYFSEFEG